MAAKNKKKALVGGRKKGSKGWSQRETDMLLDIVKELLPTGSNHWEKVALQHSLECEDNLRDADACKRKFERLAFQDKLTGSTQIPRQVQRAKNIKETISAEEVIGLCAHNKEFSSLDDSGSTEPADALSAAKLRGEDGEIRRPVTKRARVNASIGSAIEKLATEQASSTVVLAVALEGLAAKLVSPTDTNRIAQVESKLDKIMELLASK